MRLDIHRVYDPAVLNLTRCASRFPRDKIILRATGMNTTGYNGQGGGGMLQPRTTSVALSCFLNKERYIVGALCCSIVIYIYIYIVQA